MSKDTIKDLIKYSVLGLVYFVFMLSIAFITCIFLKGYEIKDIVFIEGMLSIIIGIASSLGDNSNSIFAKEFLKIISKNFKSNANHIETAVNHNLELESNIDSYSTMFIMLIGGFLIIILSFVI